MNGPGDIDGEVSGDEAAWRDLVARFDSQSEHADVSTPWPARENLADDPAPDGDPAPPRDLPGPLPAGAVQPYDRARVIRHAGDPRSYTPPDETDEPWGEPPCGAVTGGLGGGVAWTNVTPVPDSSTTVQIPSTVAGPA